LALKLTAVGILIIADIATTEESVLPSPIRSVLLGFIALVIVCWPLNDEAVQWLITELLGTRHDPPYGEARVGGAEQQTDWDSIAKGPKPPDGDTGTGNPVLRVPHQFALQSKTGDLSLAEARLDGLARPIVRPRFPHAGVLVTTGRQGRYLLFAGSMHFGSCSRSGTRARGNTA
jgi:hypothetical protein